MFPYRVQYNESDYDIQNYNLFYKNIKNTKILSKSWKANRLFTPKNRHAQTFPDTQLNPWAGAHLLWNNIISFYFYYIYIYIHIYIFIYTYIYTKIYIFIYIYFFYIYIYILFFIYLLMYIFIHLLVYIFINLLIY